MQCVIQKRSESQLRHQRIMWTDAETPCIAHYYRPNCRIDVLDGEPPKYDGRVG
jgi:hypothetical protein